MPSGLIVGQFLADVVGVEYYIVDVEIIFSHQGKCRREMNVPAGGYAPNSIAFRPERRKLFAIAARPRAHIGD
jgi:hypothetical protein